MLNSPENDARAIASALTRLGYLVRPVFNANFEVLKREIDDFSRRSSLSNAAVMYYSGHGMQFEDTNYLIPVDATIQVPDDIKDQALAIDWGLSFGILEIAAAA
jgi:uncharacterized caspase-like protein